MELHRHLFGDHAPMQRLREETGCSQEEFTFRVGLHRAYVGDIERGEKNGQAGTGPRPHPGEATRGAAAALGRPRGGISLGTSPPRSPPCLAAACSNLSAPLLLPPLPLRSHPAAEENPQEGPSSR